jgi:cation transport ATPase
MSASSEKVAEEIKGVRWVYWALVVAIVAFVANTSQGIMAAMGGTHFACIYGWSDVFMPFTIAPLAAFLPLLTILLPKRLRQTSNIAYLYIIGLIVAYTIGNWVDVWMSIPAGNILRIHFSSEQLKSILMTLWFVPPEEKIVPLIAGNATPDWIAWTPAIVASFLYGLVFSYLQ